MATRETRAPGWYPDPRDPAVIRHWDGRRWDGEPRPRPSWARRTTPGSPRARRRRLWLLGGLGVLTVAVLAVAAMATGRGPDLPPRTVADRGFTTRANALCARALPPLRRARPLPKQDPGSNAAVGGRVDQVADRLFQVVAQLRALPVAAADRAEVERWLADWDAYIAIGRRYAAALREGEARTFTSVGAEGDPVSRRIFRFSLAQGMPACAV